MGTASRLTLPPGKTTQTSSEGISCDGCVYVLTNASLSLIACAQAGWGSTSGPTQKATAGWLSVLPIFEPHWQVGVRVG